MNTETGTEAVAPQATEAGKSAPAPATEQQLGTQQQEGGQATQPDDTTSDQDQEQQGDDASREQRKRPRWSDVNRANREALDAKREAERWRELALRHQSDLGQETQRQAPQPTDPRPTLEQHNFDQAAYEDALFDWKLAQREVQSSQRQQQQMVQEARSTFEQRQADFAAAHDDYDDVVTDPSLPITQVMAGAVHESEIGPQIAYHLGKNPKEAARIAGLSPLSQAREIGKIEAALAASGAKPKPPKPNQVTNAPPPPPAVGTSSPVKRSETDMSDEERVAAIRAARIS